MKENCTSEIIYRCNYDLFHKGNIPMLSLMAVLGQLQESQSGKCNCYSKNNRLASEALLQASSNTNTVFKQEKRERDTLPTITS